MNTTQNLVPENIKVMIAINAAPSSDCWKILDEAYEADRITTQEYRELEAMLEKDQGLR